MAIAILALLLAIALFPQRGAAARLLGQSAIWRVVEASDGTLYLVHDMLRQPIEPQPISDPELAALREGEVIIDGVLPMPRLPTPTPAAGQEEPVTLTGEGTMQSHPFSLRGGAYRMLWTANAGPTSDCAMDVSLLAVETGRITAVFESNVAAGTQGSGEAYAYRVAPRDYYFGVHSTCEWSLTIGPAG